MKLIRYGLLLLAVAGSPVLWAQQFMLPPPTRQLSEPPGFDLFLTYVSTDRRGNLWATSQNGLVCFDGQRLRMVHDPQTQKNTEYGPLAVAPDGRIWVRQDRVGLTGRLAYVDPVRQQITVLPDTLALVRTYLQQDGFRTLHVDRRGQLWIGLHNNGLLRVDPKTLTAEHIFRQNVTVRTIADGPDGQIWLGTEKGLWAVDPQTGKHKNYRHESSLETTISSDTLTAVRVRSNGDVVMGLSNELDILTPGTGEIRKYRLPLPTPVSKMWTNRFVPDRLGNDYFSVGLMVFRLTKAGQLQRLEFAWPSEKVISIFVSQGHGSVPDHLWVNAARRLDEYDLSRLRPIPAMNVLDVIVNGTRLIENEHAVEDRFRRDTTGQSSLTVQEGDFVKLYFTPFAELKKSQFRYKLEGYDQQWTSYTDLIGGATYQPPAGQYSFLFNRSDYGGWEKQIASIRIRVRPIFWKTNWFIALVVAGLAGVTFWLVRAARRRQKLRRELARQESEAASLRQLDEFKTQFFANVTHELRTPLTIILNATEQLGSTDLNTYQQDRLSSVQRNARQLLRLVNETLDMAKLDAGKLDQYAQLGDPLAFVEQIVGQFIGLAQQKGIDLHWNATLQSTDSGELAYYFDENKLEKIVYNLLSNALKFTPAGGAVRVDGQLTETNQLRVRVADTGIGIPADQLGRIFERFYQRSAGAVDGSSTRAYSGTGIGLAFVRELTEWLGGSVSVESEPGQGSVFTIALPLTLHTEVSKPVARPPQLVSAVAQVSGTPEPPHPAQADVQSLVLVVEDNAELRAYVADALAAQYRVIIAENGRLGLDLAIQEIPDLIVSDVMMPDLAGPELDGFALVERLKADERTSHIPVILLTAKSSYDSRIKGLGVGADDYLGKPFSLAELILRVGNCLRTRRNWQHWLSSQSMTTNAGSDAIPAPVAHLDKEERFLSRLRHRILDHIDQENLDLDWLAAQASMSRTQLHRKLTALTTLSPNRFIHRVRVEKAAELLQSGELNVAQAAFQVGYSSPSHFSKVFQEHMGYPPARLKV